MNQRTKAPSRATRTPAPAAVTAADPPAHDGVGRVGHRAGRRGRRRHRLRHDPGRRQRRDGASSPAPSGGGAGSGSATVPAGQPVVQGPVTVNGTALAVLPDSGADPAAGQAAAGDQRRSTRSTAARSRSPTTASRS